MGLKETGGAGGNRIHPHFDFILQSKYTYPFKSDRNRYNYLIIEDFSNSEMWVIFGKTRSHN